MMFVLRSLASLVLWVVVGFCAFGFLATFEPLPPVMQWTWRVIYAAVGLGAFALGTHFVWPRTPQAKDGKSSR